MGDIQLKSATVQGLGRQECEKVTFANFIFSWKASPKRTQNETLSKTVIFQ